MHNMIYLIGRIVEDLKEYEDREEVIIHLRVNNNFDGSDTIEIPILLKNGICKHTIEYCEKGALVGIKGMLVKYNDEFVASVDRITFLASANKVKEEDKELLKDE